MTAADEAIIGAVVALHLPPEALGDLSDAQIDQMLRVAPAVSVDVSRLMAGLGRGAGGSLPSGRKVDSGLPIWQSVAKWATFAALIIGLGVLLVMRPPAPSIPSISNVDAGHGEWQVDFPPPVFVGTPAVNVPGLVDPSGNPIIEQRPRMSMRLPAEARSNVALGKRVTASEPLPLEGQLDYVTDGIRNSEAIVTLESGMQWVQIDLADSHEVYGVAVWHDYSTPTVYFDVVVAISNDPEFDQGVSIVFNNSREGAATENIGKGSDRPYFETNFGCVIETGGVNGRYVRLYSNGCSQDIVNRYTEVEIYGRPMR